MVNQFTAIAFENYRASEREISKKKYLRTHVNKLEGLMSKEVK
jgi:hypothetical protein